MKNKTFDLVKEILENDPTTRNDDCELIWEVAHRHGLDNMPFSMAIIQWRVRKLPTFEAITRARRKVQELYPQLQATANVRRGRAINEQKYFDFFSKQRQ